MYELNLENINLRSEWFDIIINNKKIEVFPKDHNTPLFIFDLSSGELSILNKKDNCIYFNNPSINTTVEPEQIFFKFMAILRNQKGHYTKC